MPKYTDEQINKAADRAADAMKRFREIREKLTPQERSTIWNALRIASEEYEKSMKEMQRVAAALRAGENVAMFVTGEAGARGADRLAAQFQSQMKDAQGLIDFFE